jgi:hypothetical protein
MFVFKKVGDIQHLLKFQVAYHILGIYEKIRVNK